MKDNAYELKLLQYTSINSAAAISDISDIKT